MALKINITSVDPLISKLIGLSKDITSIYLRIDNLTPIGKSSCKISVGLYEYLGSDEDNLTILGNIVSLTIHEELNVDIESPNLWTQGYEYLKTLPEFEGAIDC